jgi:hypothetical protein
LTAGDWAAAVITFGWAATAFYVVHVITRRPKDATQAPHEHKSEHDARPDELRER